MICLVGRKENREKKTNNDTFSFVWIERKQAIKIDLYKQKFKLLFPSILFFSFQI